MTNDASAAITGCGAPGYSNAFSSDCSYGFTKSYNNSCKNTLANWYPATVGAYNITTSTTTHASPICYPVPPNSTTASSCGGTTGYIKSSIYSNPDETQVSPSLAITTCNISQNAKPAGYTQSEGCWQGGNSSDSLNSTRTLCTYNAASAACSSLNGGKDYSGTYSGTSYNFNWRLPTSSELGNFDGTYSCGGGVLTKYNLINGLNLCNLGINPPCTSYVGCGSSSSYVCIPSNIWSSTPIGSGYYTGAFYDGGSGSCNGYFWSGTGTRPNGAWGLSTRCVRNITPSGD